MKFICNKLLKNIIFCKILLDQIHQPLPKNIFLDSLIAVFMMAYQKYAW